MRILHTSDWHLGKRLNDRERAGEQVAVMDEIVRVADEEAVDAVIVAGDLFDTFNPPVEAIEVALPHVASVGTGREALVVAIAGNHDSPDRVDSPDVLARESGIFFCWEPDDRVAGDANGKAGNAWSGRTRGLPSSAFAGVRLPVAGATFTPYERATGQTLHGCRGCRRGVAGFPAGSLGGGWPTSIVTRRG